MKLAAARVAEVESQALAAAQNKRNSIKPALKQSHKRPVVSATEVSL